MRRGGSLNAGPLLVLALLLLAFGRAQQLPASVDAALAEMDAKVVSKEDSGEELNAESSEPRSRDPDDPLDFSLDPPRFKATAREVVSALNSLDIATMKHGTTQPEPEPKEQPRGALVLFFQVANEAMSRAYNAIAALKSYNGALDKHIKAEGAALNAWVRAQIAQAQQAMRNMKGRYNKANIEAAHLEKVYEEAVGKERAYQTQINQLVSEHELQKTPPVLPVVAAATLSDEQFNDSLGKLNHYLEQARKLMKDTQTALHQRRIEAKKMEQWLEQARSALKTWTEKQRNLVEERKKANEKELDAAKGRLSSIEAIYKDATSFQEQYGEAIRRVDLKTKIAHLEANLKHYESTKTHNAYDEARVKTYTQGLQLEIDGLKKKLDEIKSDGKVPAPPAIWGVLAQFPPALIHQLEAQMSHDFYHLPGMHLSGGPVVAGASSSGATTAPVPASGIADMMEGLSPWLDSDLDYSVRTPTAEEQGLRYGNLPSNTDVSTPGAGTEDQQQQADAADDEEGGGAAAAQEEGGQAEATEGGDAEKAKFRERRSDTRLQSSQKSHSLLPDGVPPPPSAKFEPLTFVAPPTAPDLPAVPK